MRVGIITKTILSLRGKVMLVVAAGMAFAFGVFTVVVFTTEHALVETQIVHNHRESTNSFAAFLSRPARVMDFNMIQEMLGRKAREENIVYALIRDSTGKIVAKAGQWEDMIPAHAVHHHAGAGEGPDGAREVRKPVSLLHTEGHVFEVDETIPDLGLAGDWTVHVGVDTHEANQKVIDNTKRIVLLSGIVLVFSLVTMFLIDQRLRRIFRDLINVTCRMASGDRSLRVDIRTGDELQILGESFNAMANTLREKENQVRNYAENLEVRVRERTHELLAEKQKLGAILGAIRAGLILYTPERNPVWANDIAQGWLNGADPVDSEMKRDLFEGRGGVEEIVERALENRTALEVEKRVSDTTGEAHYFQISATPITTEGGEGLQAVLLLRDVSEQRRLEKRLQHAGKMVAIGELAGGVAHEINTPVGVVINKAEFLLERLQERATEKDIGDIEKILRNAQRIAAITRGLLTFSRESSVDRKKIDLNSLAQETIVVLAERLQRSGVEVETSLDLDLPRIQANADEIQQVLLNLLNNAIDAMGGSQEERRLQVSTAREGGFVILEVTDNGSGIPPVLRERIFEPFFSTKGVGKGTGLGLAISLGIVKGHGGQIVVDSRVNRGTTFAVRLPAEAESVVYDGERQSV